MAVRFVVLTAGGREWRLRFAMSAWAALEDSGYGSLEAFFAALQKSPPSLKGIAVGLWAMLQEEDDPPTLREVKKWIDSETMPDILAKMGEAIAAAFPKPPENASPPLEGRGTGMRSSASPTAVSV